jgi:addiction module HigA family antidote
MATIIEKTLRMHNPAHPGEILRELYLEPLEISITKAAAAMGVMREHVSAIVNGHASVTPEMAARLAMVFMTEKASYLSRYMFTGEHPRRELSPVSC